jgi:hypothetical protein
MKRNARLDQALVTVVEGAQRGGAAGFHAVWLVKAAAGRARARRKASGAPPEASRGLASSGWLERGELWKRSKRERQS